MWYRPLPHELSALARKLMTVALEEQPMLARTMLEETELAGLRVWATGRCHPHYGDGSLIARVMADATPLPPLSYADAPAYLHALRIAAEALLKHTARYRISAPGCPHDPRVPLAKAEGEDDGRDQTARDHG